MASPGKKAQSTWQIWKARANQTDLNFCVRLECARDAQRFQKRIVRCKRAHTVGVGCNEARSCITLAIWREAERIRPRLWHAQNLGRQVWGT